MVYFGNHKFPSYLGASVFGILFLMSCYHLKLLNRRKKELADRSFGAQATLDEPFRRSLRAKAAFHMVVAITSALEIPLFLAFQFTKQYQEGDDDGCSSVAEQSLVSYEIPDVEPQSWIHLALASHLIALAGYPIVLTIIIGMWAEVIRNVPGAYRPSMAVRDHGSNHEARLERRNSRRLGSRSLSRANSLTQSLQSSSHSHRSSGNSQTNSTLSQQPTLLSRICYCCDIDEDEESEAGYSLGYSVGGGRGGINSSTHGFEPLSEGVRKRDLICMLYEELECCGARPLKHRPLMVFAIFAYTMIAGWACVNALLYAGSTYDSYHNFISNNLAYGVQFIVEPALLMVLALAVLISGRKLRHRVKFSDGPRLRKVEGKIALVAFAAAFLAIIRAFAVTMAVFSQFHTRLIPRHGCEDGKFGILPVVWASLLSSLLPHAGLFVCLFFIMGCPRELPASANLNEGSEGGTSIWNPPLSNTNSDGSFCVGGGEQGDGDSIGQQNTSLLHQEGEEEDDEVYGLARSQSSPPVLVKPYQSKLINGTPATSVNTTIDHNGNEEGFNRHYDGYIPPPMLSVKSHSANSGSGRSVGSNIDYEDEVRRQSSEFQHEKDIETSSSNGRSRTRDPSPIPSRSRRTSLRVASTIRKSKNNVASGINQTSSPRASSQTQGNNRGGDINVYIPGRVLSQRSSSSSSIDVVNDEATPIDETRQLRKSNSGSVNSFDSQSHGRHSSSFNSYTGSFNEFNGQLLPSSSSGRRRSRNDSWSPQVVHEQIIDASLIERRSSIGSSAPPSPSSLMSMMENNSNHHDTTNLDENKLTNRIGNEEVVQHQSEGYPMSGDNVRTSTNEPPLLRPQLSEEMDRQTVL